MGSTGAEANSSAPVSAEKKRLAAVEAIAELRHPHLIVMRSLGDERGFEPDLAGGRLLSELQQAQGGSLSLRIALRILLDAMSGLAALHRARSGGKLLDFVHGALIPANIVVGRDGIARVVPLVKAHWSPGATAAPGVTGYTAPEKLLGDAFDQRADVFSAGVLLWEAMEGKPLFGDLSVDDIVTQLVGGKVNRPRAVVDAPWSAELADVVMSALAVDPADRWEHVGAMGADIETIAEGQVAKSSEVAVLVTGRQVSRDSLSDEVTRPLSSVPSLVPFANSIPASPDEPTAPHSPGALAARRADSTEPVVGESVVANLLTQLAVHRRWAIVASAMAFSVLLLAVAGYKNLERKSVSTAEATVLAPAAAPPAVSPPGFPAAEEPAPPVDSDPNPTANAPPTAGEPLTESAPSESPLSALAVAASSRAAHEAKGARSSPKPSPSSGKAKPKDDPFGLMKPVRAKPKDDPFGL